MEKLKKLKTLNIILAFTSLFLCYFISTGYAALSKNLNLKGTISFFKAADVRVTAASLKTTTNSATQTSAVTYDYQSISATVNMPNLTSTVTYNVTVTNYTNQRQQLNSYWIGASSNEDVIAVLGGITAGGEIPANGTKTFTITLKYDPEITQVTDAEYYFGIYFDF